MLVKVPPWYATAARKRAFPVSNITQPVKELGGGRTDPALVRPIAALVRHKLLIRDATGEHRQVTLTADELASLPALAEAAARAGDDQVPRLGRGALKVSQELFEAERALTEAARRLASTAEALREIGRG